MDIPAFQRVILFLSWYVNECYRDKHTADFLSRVQYSHNHITDDERKHGELKSFSTHAIQWLRAKFLAYPRELLVVIYITLKLILTQT